MRGRGGFPRGGRGGYNAQQQWGGGYAPPQQTYGYDQWGYAPQPAYGGYGQQQGGYAGYGAGY